MTSHSENFQPGETVFEAFAWIRPDDTPTSRIRRAVFDRGPDGNALLRYADGRVDSFWPTSRLRAFRTHVEAVAHCTAVLVGFRRDIEAEIERLMDLADESGGPARGGCASEAAGTAPPEVAK